MYLPFHPHTKRVVTLFLPCHSRASGNLGTHVKSWMPACAGITTKTAFSLVELSIVLVILGLLTGGILTGQSLIRASELRSVATDTSRFQTSIYTFRDKYMGMPGDLRNATAFWGTAAACPGTAGSTTITIGTCNGDGNGIIAGRNGSTAGNDENFRIWQHLVGAGLMEGQYTGITGSTANDFTVLIGINSPRGKISNSGFTIQGPIVAGTGSSIFEGVYNHRLVFGAQATNASLNSPVLKPEEAWNIDTKLDDGRPGLGTVKTRTSLHNAGCTTSDTPSVSEYALTATGTVCSFVIDLRI
jgi:prepilin-type N-terminal cleavage/methylation domain-containing protein